MLKERMFKKIEEQPKKAVEALRSILAVTNLEKADYAIILQPCSPNEQPIAIYNCGSLEESIKKAGNEFREVNRVKDVQAEWSVRLRLGGIADYEIPVELWIDYARKFDLSTSEVAFAQLHM